jgi:hypothetical protein
VGGEIGEDVVGAGGEDLHGLEVGQRPDFSYYLGLYAEGQDDELDLVCGRRELLTALPHIRLDAGGQAAERFR